MNIHFKGRYFLIFFSQFLQNVIPAKRLQNSKNNFTFEPPLFVVKQEIIYEKNKRK